MFAGKGIGEIADYEAAISPAPFRGVLPLPLPALRTEIVKMEGRGHSLTIDSGWREVAEKALEFVKRFRQAQLASTRIVSRPCPARDLTERMELRVGRGMRILHRNLRSKFDVLAQGLPEGRVGRQSGRVGGGHVQLDESLALWFFDIQVAMRRDETGKASHLTGEAVGSPEAFGIERRQMGDVMGSPLAEERL